MVHVMLDRERDVLLTGDMYDVDDTKEFLNYLEGAAHQIGLLVSENRIFKKDDAECLVICCMMLLDSKYIPLVKELNLGYVTRVFSNVSRQMICTPPEVTTNSIMLDPADTIDFDKSLDEWCGDSGISRHELTMLVCYAIDLSRYYKERIE